VLVSVCVCVCVCRHQVASGMLSDCSSVIDDVTILADIKPKLEELTTTPSSLQGEFMCCATALSLSHSLTLSLSLSLSLCVCVCVCARAHICDGTGSEYQY